MAAARCCSVFVGSETGIVKGVSLTRKQAFNFCDTRQLSREREVRALCWADPAERALLVGSADGVVRTLSTDTSAFTHSRRCAAHADGGFVGLAALDDDGRALLTCTESGRLCAWRGESGDEPAAELHAGAHVCRMRQSPVDRQRVATGGKENGLKIWDLQRPHEPVFTAKNLRDDWLDLRRPHWVKDVAFIRDSERVVTCTGYHQVHVFDPSSPRRRPVLEAEFGEHPLTAMSLAADGVTVTVGNTAGQMALLDLRRGGQVVGALKGAVGAVRGLQCHPWRAEVASCGLDRFLRVHSVSERTTLHRVYLKSRLNCLLLSSREEEGAVEVKKEEEEEGVEEVEEVWDSMEKVEEKNLKRKPEEEAQKKKKKKKSLD